MTALAVIVGATLALAPAHGGRPLRPGDADPLAIGSRSSTLLTVAWVFDLDGVFTCETAAPVLRELRSRFGDRVQVAVVGVGMDSTLIGSFLRKERLNVALHALGREEGEDAFGPHALPLLYTARNGVVMEVRRTTAPGWDEGVQDAVGRLLGDAPAPPTVVHP